MFELRVLPVGSIPVSLSGGEPMMLMLPLDTPVAQIHMYTCDLLHAGDPNEWRLENEAGLRLFPHADDEAATNSTILAGMIDNFTQLNLQRRSNEGGGANAEVTFPLSVAHPDDPGSVLVVEFPCSSTFQLAHATVCQQLQLEPSTEWCLMGNGLVLYPAEDSDDDDSDDDDEADDDDGEAGRGPFEMLVLGSGDEFTLSVGKI